MVAGVRTKEGESCVCSTEVLGSILTSPRRPAGQSPFLRTRGLLDRNGRGEKQPIWQLRLGETGIGVAGSVSHGMMGVAGRCCPVSRGALSAQKELSHVNVGGLHPVLAMGTDMRSVIADGGTGTRGGLLGVPGASAPRPVRSSLGRCAEEGAGRVWAQGGGHSLRRGSGSAGGQGALSTPGAVPGAGLGAWPGVPPSGRGETSDVLALHTARL